jgi:hypothetical protein
MYTVELHCHNDDHTGRYMRRSAAASCATAKDAVAWCYSRLMQTPGAVGVVVDLVYDKPPKNISEDAAVALVKEGQGHATFYVHIVDEWGEPTPCMATIQRQPDWTDNWLWYGKAALCVPFVIALFLIGMCGLPLAIVACLIWSYPLQMKTTLVGFISTVYACAVLQGIILLIVYLNGGFG